MVISARTARLTVRAAALATAALTSASLVAPPGQAAAPERRPAPSHIALPNGFQPEGIATKGKFAYLGSRADGDIYRVNLTTGRGRVISQGPGTPSLGMKVDGRGRLFVSGGTGGDARVIDTRTGRLIRGYQLTTDEGGAFVNDVILTKRAAWFTDSAQQQLYRVAIGKHGKLGAARTVHLSGQWKQVEGNNANGIARTPDQRALLVINSSSGVLYRVGAAGKATAVNATGPLLTNGDGLWREGRKLFVVQNQLNRIAVLRLNPAGTAFTLLRYRTSSDFDVPTTIARYRGSLYLPNARFSTPATATTPYWITRLSAPR
jgi:sugar lactone lactonase YvrE